MQEHYHTLIPYHKPLRSLKYDMFKIWNPSWFQGNRVGKTYFEGWYFKNVSADGVHRWAFIPGISMVGDDPHAFIQAIDGSNGKTHYFRFPADQFAFSKRGFEVSIGDNHFSSDGFSLNIDDGENSFAGKIRISGRTGYKAGLRRPGIMGWYRYVPFMECYHGVVSLDHRTDGELIINGRSIDLDNGRGYIEKDWGTSMPGSWIWMQSNHFTDEGTSFMMSVARIPWIGKTFTGFLGFFHYEGKTITFATYTGAKITELTWDTNTVNIHIDTGKELIEINGKNQSTGALKAPVLGKMDRVIHESINAELNLTLRKKNGEMIYTGTGMNAGLEMVGDLGSLK